MAKLCFYTRQLFILFAAIMLPVSNVTAGSRNKPVIEYFTDNILTQILVSGGYYTLGVIVIMLVLSAVFKGFRIIFFSVVMAIFGILLLVFVFESLDNLEWIPPIYT